MGLEAEGSTPSIYPIFSIWFVDPDRRNIPLLKLNWTTVYLSSIKTTLPELRLFLLNNKQVLYNQRVNNLSLKLGEKTLNKGTKHLAFLEQEFRLNFKLPQSVRERQQVKFNSPKVSLSTGLEVKMLKMFKTFIKLNSNSAHNITTTHFSFKSFYMGHRRGGLVILNTRKLFTRWKDIYHLLFNLFFYKLDMLLFGSSFFKSELLALNWQNMEKFKFMWRYTRPFLTLKSNKITTYGDFVFSRIGSLGFRLSLLVDVLYHNKTIYYLHRSGFYTMGLVPVNYNMNSVNFAIPTSSDSLMAQIFFIRFTTLVKQSTLTSRYNDLKRLWLSV